MTTTERSEDGLLTRIFGVARWIGRLLVSLVFPLAVAGGCYAVGYRDGAREAKVAMFGVMERLLKAGNDDGKREYR